MQASQVTGYDTLTHEHQELFKAFLINFTKQLTRFKFEPISIYFVEEVTSLGRESPEDEHYIPLGANTYIIYPNSSKELLQSWQDADYKHLLPLLTERRKYLRFDYKINGREGWQHVIDKNTWY